MKDILTFLSYEIYQFWNKFYMCVELDKIKICNIS